MIDTGRGTFTVSGRPISEPDILERLTIADFESAVEVPMSRRSYYGGTEGS